MMETPFWIRVIEWFSDWECRYLTHGEIILKRRPSNKLPKESHP